MPCCVVVNRNRWRGALVAKKKKANKKIFFEVLILLFEKKKVLNKRKFTQSCSLKVGLYLLMYDICSVCVCVGGSVGLTDDL